MGFGGWVLGNKTEAVEQLLASGADVNTVDGTGAAGSKAVGSRPRV